jgi:membrane protease YdiL (CAAX protease family)
MRGLKLTGMQVVAISSAAGLGEEILFRAALQPLMGLWLAAALFAIAHIRSAALADSKFKKVVYLLNVCVIGVGLGLVFQFLGLLTAIATHSIIDWAALASLRRLQLHGGATPLN